MNGIKSIWKKMDKNLAYALSMICFLDGIGSAVLAKELNTPDIEVVEVVPETMVTFKLEGSSDRINVCIGSTDIDWSSYFETDGEVLYDDSNIDLNKEGIYQLIVRETDGTELSRTKVQVKNTTGEKHPKSKSEYEAEQKEKVEKTETAEETAATTEAVEQVAETTTTTPTTQQTSTETKKETTAEATTTATVKEANASAVKSYVGLGYPAFDGTFFGKYADQAKVAYDNLSNGEEGTILFETQADADSLKNIFVTQLGVQIKQYGTSKDGVKITYQVSSDSNSVIEKCCRDIAKTIAPNGGREKELITKTANWISNNISYAISMSEVENALNDGQGNCYAMSKVAKYILQCYGIKSDICIGTADGQAHGWLIVHLESGENCYFDPTYYATGGRDSQYLVSSELWSSHVLQYFSI